MGKIDDMRRQREERHAQGVREAKARTAAADGGPARAAEAVVPAPAVVEAPVVRYTASSFGRRKPAPDEEGTCSVCGKVRPLQGGLISGHQKGLGKMCTGSRKPPA